jgi:hypothetical protein
MTDAERERLVEEYLAGELSPDREQEFILRAATDGRLSEMLRAYRTMERALRKNRDSMPDGYLAVHTHVIEKLSATPATHAGTPRTGTPRTGAFFTRTMLALTVIVSVAAGFLLHALTVSPAEEPSPTPPMIRPETGVMHSPGKHEAPSPSSDINATRSLPQPSPVGAPPAHREGTESPQERKGSRTTEEIITRRAPTPEASMEPAPVAAQPTSSESTPHHDTLPSASARSAETEPRRMQRDSVEFRVKVLPPKKR